MHEKEELLTQYADKGHLQARVDAHRKYSVAPVNFVSWALDQLPLRGNERMLDAGCGSGAWLFPLADRLQGRGGTAIGLDLSAGMIESIREKAIGRSNVELLVGDIQALPFADAELDFVMANFCLYHVPDIHAAIEECVRVTRPGGYLMFATGSLTSLSELEAIHMRWQVRLGFPVPIIEHDAPVTRFSLENGGAFMRAHFPYHEVHSLADWLRFPTSAAVMEYWNSGPLFRGATARGAPRVKPDLWDRLASAIEGEIEGIVQKRGAFDTAKISGFFLAKR